MSAHALDRARQLLDMLFAVTARPLKEHAEACEEVESWLEDEASRSAYRRELTFKLLYTLVGNKALRFSPLSPAACQQALQQAEEAAAKGLFPELDTGLPEDHAVLRYLRVATFILNQYEYKDHVSPGPGDIMLDCGGCFGETAIWAREYGVEKVYSFEPNPSTFVLLERNAQRYDPDRSWFFPIASAVGRQEGILRLAEDVDNPAASHIDPDGSLKIPVVALDAWCEQHNIIPSFVKMDLEGHEAATIMGAERIFREIGPRFAISLYHRLQDMWQLPQMLKKLRPDYKFWCKKSGVTADFILFGSIE